LSIPSKIIRWDYWLKHPRYKNARKVIEASYNNDITYRKAYEYSIVEFFDRRNNYAFEHPFNQNNFYKNSLEYLKEECSIMILWAEYGFNFEVYPNKRATVLAQTYEKIIKP